jgi:HEAT repeat protein
MLDATAAAGIDAGAAAESLLAGPWADKDVAARALKLRGDPRPQVAAAGAAACRLLATTGYDTRPGAAHDVILALAEDEDWITRETAAVLGGLLLAAHFERAYAVFEDWAGHPSARVRRAVAVSVRYAGRLRVLAWGPALMHLLRRLLCDADPYVRRNLGPFAIGDGMLRYYPCLTLAKLKAWGTYDDEQARWNVAMAFSAAQAAHHLPEALEALTALAGDDRRYVWRAAAAALRSLGRRHPEAVLPLLRSWASDPRRSRPAGVALRYLARGPGPVPGPG